MGRENPRNPAYPKSSSAGGGAQVHPQGQGTPPHIGTQPLGQPKMGQLAPGPCSLWGRAIRQSRRVGGDSPREAAVQQAGEGNGPQLPDLALHPPVQPLRLQGHVLFRAQQLPLHEGLDLREREQGLGEIMLVPCPPSPGPHSPSPAGAPQARPTASWYPSPGLPHPLSVPLDPAPWHGRMSHLGLVLAELAFDVGGAFDQRPDVLLLFTLGGKGVEKVSVLGMLQDSVPAPPRAARHPIFNPAIAPFPTEGTPPTPNLFTPSFPCLPSPPSSPNPYTPPACTPSTSFPPGQPGTLWIPLQGPPPTDTLPANPTSFSCVPYCLPTPQAGPTSRGCPALAPRFPPALPALTTRWRKSRMR